MPTVKAKSVIGTGTISFEVKEKPKPETKNK